MKYTTKMILVPEDVYKELVTAAVSKLPRTTIKLESTEKPAVEKQLIAQTKKTMKKIARIDALIPTSVKFD